MGIEFHLYGFFVGLGIAIAILLFEKVVEKERINISTNALVLWVLIPGIIGARVYHLVTDWQLYQSASLLDLVALWRGGLGVIGALVGGMIGVIIYLTWSKKIGKFWLILDVFALVLHFAQAVGRWGNFFNQELYGVETSLPWGIKIDAAYLLPGLDPSSRYHPLFLYESIAMLALGAFLWILYQRKSLGELGSGKYFAVYSMYYAAVRFTLEFLRVDTSRVAFAPFHLLSIAQWMMVGLFLLGFVLYNRESIKQKQ
jgi:phosphatidylglycerol:prolipoprotein diacylglycerol transferase